MPQKRDECLLSLLSLGIKLGVILVASVSCSKLTVAHQRTRALYREVEAEYARQQEHLLVARRAFAEIFQIDRGGGQRVAWDPPPSDDPERPAAGSP
ncbi:MAG: hypothetical protein F4Y87_02145 [Synechococcus sp. SB0665_bin_28]|nr:hypothetical protein [Synechococcus sp. SB0665_bin_28]MYF19287.1 hypothetical protein [Synechococcus sp. SB0677_bin_5]